MASVTGRRDPTLECLHWKSDVVIIKTAALLDDARLLHVFAVVLRFLDEKCLDKHGIRVGVLDPSGDSNYLSEQLLVREVGVDGCPFVVLPQIAD